MVKVTKNNTASSNSEDSIDQKYEFTWSRESLLLTLLYYVLCVCSGFILVVIVVNYPHVRSYFTQVRCSPEDADLVVVMQLDKSLVEEGELAVPVPVEHYNHPTFGVFACFDAFGARFVAKKDENWKIKQISTNPDMFTERYILGTDPDRINRDLISCLYGKNRIYVPAADVLTVILQEILSPFYLFQYVAIAVWIWTLYYIYSAVVIFITVISIAFCIYQKLFNLKRLHDLAGYEGFVRLYDLEKNILSEKLSSDIDLVPGDCFLVTSGMVLPADAILVRGRVVVDESMLTGEAIPITKTPFELTGADKDATKRTANILYSGTTVKSVNQGGEALAITYRTGFRSARGGLIAALITPTQGIVQFLPDALSAIFFMVFLTTCIFIWSVLELVDIDSSDVDIAEAYLTALTIAVPPGLVACLSIGTSIAVTRLTEKDISITDTGKLNAAGYVSYACFDKTGTLTDDNISYKGCILFEGDVESTSPQLEQIMNETMASCHSLSLVNSEVVGDPLEVELFGVSNWTMKFCPTTKQTTVVPPSTQPHANESHTILKQFEFSPEKLRACTLLKRPDEGSVFLVKGSPEMIVSLSTKDSVPTDISQNLSALAKSGYRVIALAYKTFSVEETKDSIDKTQEELEVNLTFVGLLYFTNMLKPDTFPLTIHSLRDADVSINMITGDHFHTAAAVSIECEILNKDLSRVVVDLDPSTEKIVLLDGITDEVLTGVTVTELIDHYYALRGQGSLSENVALQRYQAEIQIIVTGAAFRVLKVSHEQVLECLCRITSVFARMQPADKQKVVTELMKPNSRSNSKKDCHVIYCGDGANDMDALSTATVGVSLCDTSTTVAATIVSTSQTPFAVVEVLKEGRCSLVTAYMLVNYNIMFAFIQLFMTCFLNNVGLVFGDYMYLVQDMFFSFFLGLAIANTPASDKLSKELPPQSLFDPWLLSKLTIQVGIFPAFQAILLEILRGQAWFSAFVIDDDAGPLVESYAWEGGILNILCLVQLMIASVVVTIGEPFRKPWYTNKIHWAVLAGQTAYIFYLIFAPDDEFLVGVDNKTFPDKFGGILVGVIIANLFASIAGSKIVDYLFLKPATVTEDSSCLVRADAYVHNLFYRIRCW